MNVDLIDHMGSDLTVCNAARVSFHKETDWLDEEKSTLDGPDQRLIQYLAKHNHWSPFSHAFASFRIKAPIFVARQLQKHTVGLAWNEVSRRYVDSEPEFYCPEKGQWRLRAENVKQGSSSETFIGTVYMDPSAMDDSPRSVMTRCVRMYTSMVDQGICPEQARMVLPQSMYTEWIWSGSLYAFARVCKLRLDPHTQIETRQIAEQINDHMRTLFPESWKALLNG